MANSLNRDIEAGEVLVIRKAVVLDAYSEVSSRLFVAREGPGMIAGAHGGATIRGENYSFADGRYVNEGRTRYSGHDISKRETVAWQREHGKFIEPTAEEKAG